MPRKRSVIIQYAQNKTRAKKVQKGWKTSSGKCMKTLPATWNKAMVRATRLRITSIIRNKMTWAGEERKGLVISLRGSNSTFPVHSERNFQLCLSPLITSQNVLSGWGIWLRGRVLCHHLKARGAFICIYLLCWQKLLKWDLRPEQPFVSSLSTCSLQKLAHRIIAKEAQLTNIFGAHSFSGIIVTTSLTDAQKLLGIIPHLAIG